jgi:chemotaxis protein methyltransferase CheR
MINFHNLEEAQTLAQAIVNTIPEPFLVLDHEFRVMAASRSFYQVFKVDVDQTLGRLLFALGNGQWDIPALRTLLETVIPELTSMEGFEVEHDFPNVGRRSMLLNARKVIYEDSSISTILLAFIDVTAQRAAEQEKAELLRQTEELLRQQQMLLQEMQHRVGNSLQIIASILLLKARAVTSEETRHHLEDAHKRVMSVAAVQQHLNASNGIGEIEVSSYLTKLCESLGASMIGDNHPIDIRVEVDRGMMSSRDAVGIGLIVTELLINAIKYAFPNSRAAARVTVGYMAQGTGWRLTVADNGAGKIVRPADQPSTGGLGTAIVKALVSQLGAAMETTSSAEGMRIQISHPVVASGQPIAA